MDRIKCSDLFDLNETIAKEYFAEDKYPWELLEGISDFICKLGPTLPKDKFEQRGENVWVAKNAKVFDSAYLGGPLIVDEGAEIRHCAFIRGSAIVGKGSVIGNSAELKNVIIFNNCEVPHYNYVGDSILGFHAHMGAGSITSNVKSDRAHVIVKGEQSYDTGRKKVGAMLGDWAEIGCNAVLNPGTIVGRRSVVYPTSCVRGVIPEDHIFKNDGKLIGKTK